MSKGKNKITKELWYIENDKKKMIHLINYNGQIIASKSKYDLTDEIEAQDAISQYRTKNNSVDRGIPRQHLENYIQSFIFKSISDFSKKREKLKEKDKSEEEILKIEIENSFYKEINKMLYEMYCEKNFGVEKIYNYINNFREKNPNAFTSETTSTLNIMKNNDNYKHKKLLIIIPFVAELYETKSIEDAILLYEENSSLIDNWFSKKNITFENANSNFGKSKNGTEKKYKNDKSKTRIGIIQDNDNYIQKDEILTNIAKLNEKEFNKLFNDAMSHYKLKILCEEIKSRYEKCDTKNFKFCYSNKFAIEITKRHYMNNVHTNESLVPEIKLMLSMIHNFMKIRAVDKFEGRDDDFKQNMANFKKFVNKTYNPMKLEEKIKISINSKIDNHIMKLGKLSFYKLNEATSTDFEYIRANEKFFYSLNKALSLIAIQLKNLSTDKKADPLGDEEHKENYTDSKGSGKSWEESFDNFKNFHWLKTLEQNSKEYSKVLDDLRKIRHEIIHASRNVKKLAKLDSENIILEELNFIQKNIPDLVMERLKSTRIIDVYYPNNKENFEELIKLINLDSEKKYGIPRFNKIYTEMIKKNLINKLKCDAPNTARRSIMQMIYDTNHVEMTEATFLKNCVEKYNCLEGSNIKIHYEEDFNVLYATNVKLNSKNKQTINRFNRVWNSFIAFTFSEYLTDKKVKETILSCNDIDNYEVYSKGNKIIDIFVEKNSPKFESDKINFIVLLALLLNKSEQAKLLHEIEKFTAFTNDMNNFIVKSKLLTENPFDLKETTKILKFILEYQVKSEINYNDELLEFNFIFDNGVLEAAEGDIRKITYKVGDNDVSPYSSQGDEVNLKSLDIANQYGLTHIIKDLYTDDQKITIKDIEQFEILHEQKDTLSLRSQEFFSELKSMKKMEKEDFNEVKNKKMSIINSRIRLIEEKNFTDINGKQNAYSMLKNRLYFNEVNQITKIYIELYSKLIHWVSIYERDARYFLHGLLEIHNISNSKNRGKLTTYDVSKASESVLSKISDGNRYEKNFLLSTVDESNIRNLIAHFNYFSGNDRPLIEYFSDVQKDLLKYSKKYQKDVFISISAIFEKNGIKVEPCKTTENYKEFPKQLKYEALEYEDLSGIKLVDDRKAKLFAQILGSPEDFEKKNDAFSFEL